MSNDIKTTEVETTQPQTQETTVNKTRKDARQVIRTHILDAVADLGGKAQGEPIKQWILNKVGAKVEDFGRTPENKKYPNGRYAFVECYTHIQRDFKKKGLLFTPAWGWVSLTEGETVEVEGKALSKPKKTAESTRKVESEATEEAQTPTETLSVEPHEEETVVEVESEEVTPVEPQTSADEYVVGFTSQEEEDDYVAQNPPPTVLERVLELTEDHDVHVNNNAVIESWVDVENQELVEDVGGSNLYRKALSDVEEGYILSISDVHVEEVVLQEEKSEAFEVKPFGNEVKAEIDPNYDEEVRFGTDAEGREWTRTIDTLPEEYSTPIEKETKADEYVLEQEDLSESEEYVLPEQEVETVVAQESGSEEYSLDDLFDDDFFDEDVEQEDKKKRHSLDLKDVDGEIWGEIKDGFVYLADSPDPTTVLKFKEDLKDETEGKTQEKKEKHSKALQQISSKGLPTYVKILKNASAKMKNHYEEGDERFATHMRDEFHGCFGNIETNKTLCSLTCPISQLCTNASVVEI